nr:GxxExxY protein [Chryseobacterium sp. CY350]
MKSFRRSFNAKIYFQHGGAALEVHKTIGVGLLEIVYEVTLAYELKELGFKVKNQSILPLKYKNEIIDNAYRKDLIVEDKVIIEIESVLELHPVFIRRF